MDATLGQIKLRKPIFLRLNFQKCNIMHSMVGEGFHDAKSGHYSEPLPEVVLSQPKNIIWCSEGWRLLHVVHAAFG
jgi:hypothetical protein